MNEIVLRGELAQIELRILKRSYPESSICWERNWLDAEVKIEIPGANAKYCMDIMVNDLISFHAALVQINALQSQKAEFVTLERGLYLACEVSRRGSVTCTGQADLQYHNSLEFNFETDLISIGYATARLESLLKQYPLISDIESSLK